MKGVAVAHGAATVVNAIATGRGAAFGISLETIAEVELNASGRIKVALEGNEGEDDTLARLCVRGVLDRFAANEGYGAKVRTTSQIPVSRGLKSSSAAANAVVLATLQALDQETDRLDLIRIGTKAAIEAGVSVTGAFDDACASMLGGLVVTDNRSEQLVKRTPMSDGLKVLIHVPARQIRKQGLPLDRMKVMSPQVDIAMQKVLVGKWQEAMVLNSLCYSAALGLDPKMTVEGLMQGAVAAGLSGTGPATVIVVKERRAEAVRDALGGRDILFADVYNGEE